MWPNVRPKSSQAIGYRMCFPRRCGNSWGNNWGEEEGKEEKEGEDDWGSSDAFGGRPEGLLGRLGALEGRLGGLLGRLGALWRGSSAILRPSSGHLGLSWGHTTSLLGRLGRSEALKGETQIIQILDASRIPTSPSRNDAQAS